MLANNGFSVKATHSQFQHTLGCFSHIHFCHSGTRTWLLSPLFRAASLISKGAVHFHRGFCHHSKRFCSKSFNWKPKCWKNVLFFLFVHFLIWQVSPSTISNGAWLQWLPSVYSFIHSSVHSLSMNAASCTKYHCFLCIVEEVYNFSDSYVFL